MRTASGGGDLRRIFWRRLTVSKCWSAIPRLGVSRRTRPRNTIRTLGAYLQTVSHAPQASSPDDGSLFHCLHVVHQPYSTFSISSTGHCCFRNYGASLLGAGLLFLPVVILTGLFTWWINYLARP